MKLLVVLGTIVMLVTYHAVSYGDPPGGPDPPSVPGNGHGGNGDQFPAPIDGGLSLLLFMSAGYGLIKSKKSGMGK